MQSAYRARVFTGGDWLGSLRQGAMALGGEVLDRRSVRHRFGNATRRGTTWRRKRSGGGFHYYSLPKLCGCRCDPFCSVWIDSFFYLPLTRQYFAYERQHFAYERWPVLEFHQFTII
jgi:hypothetical protein